MAMDQKNVSLLLIAVAAIIVFTSLILFLPQSPFGNAPVLPGPTTSTEQESGNTSANQEAIPNGSAFLE